MTHITNDSLTSAAAGMTATRSKFKTLSYTASAVDTTELFNAYSGSWATQRFIDKRVGDAFREWREWQAEAGDITKLEATEKRIKLKAKGKEACTLADVGGQSYIYIDTNDTVDRMDPISPASMGSGCIRFLTVLSYGHLTEGEIDRDPMSPTYGQPKWYEIYSESEGNTYIHPSRIVKHYGKKRVERSSFEVRGESLLTPALDAIKQHGSTLANVADLVFEAKIDVIGVKDLMSQVATTAGADAVAARYTLMGLMKSNNGMIVKDLDLEDYQQKQMSFATLPDIILSTEHQLSASGSYPHSIFMGTSTGGLGSTGNLEISTYHETVSEYQNNKITAQWDVLDELVIIDAIGSRPAAVHYNWKPLGVMTDKEKAEVGKMQSETIKNLQELFPDEVIAPAAINLFTEAGTMNGIEQSYKDWVGAGGKIGESDDEGDAMGDEQEL